MLVEIHNIHILIPQYLSSFSSVVAEFDLWLRVNIGCILNFETEYGEAANVLYAIDDLNAAMNLRIELQKDIESGDFFPQTANYKGRCDYRMIPKWTISRLS